MGALWFSGAELVGWFSELVGGKLGISVTETDLEKIVNKCGLAEFWPDDIEAQYRYRSEVLEDLAQAVLGAFGDPEANAVRRSLLVLSSVIREFPDFSDAFPVVDYTRGP